MTKQRKIIIIALSVALPIILIFGACAIYLGTYYKADDTAVTAFLSTSDIKPITQERLTIFEAENATSAFIFYPGGKVEHEAYFPLMQACAERGILCIIVEMPFRLAVLDINGADGIREMYPEIESWYIGGHSLGGSMAASYLSNNKNAFDGLILLGSYSTEDFTGTDIRTLSIHGSEDCVMNKEKYDESKPNISSNLTEYIIEGGNHAQFGMYGAQSKDGEPAITNEKQIEITAHKIAEFVK